MSATTWYRLKLREVAGDFHRSWDVFDRNGTRLGVLERTLHWNGFRYTTPRWSAALNPTGAPFGCIANRLDLKTKREAIDALERMSDDWLRAQRRAHADFR